MMGTNMIFFYQNGLISEDMNEPNEAIRYIKVNFLNLNLPSRISILLSIISLLASLYLCTIYGWGDFNGLKLSGAFKVGHKRIYASKHKMAVSVFYPMDEERYNR
jgi:hypothetical protein